MSLLRILWPMVVVTMLGVGRAGAVDDAGKTNSPGHLTVIKYCLEPFRTFEIVGTDVKGIKKLGDLTAALRKHRQAHPEAEYELLAEVKSVPEGERAIIDAVSKAGITLKYYWAAFSGAPAPGVKIGPHGVGFYDILPSKNERR
jgi:hypothetical protein